jgi:hypothetical protein
VSPASRKRVVGFVCEGSTDIVILRAFSEAILGPIDAIALQPQTDELDRSYPGAPSGWSEVRAWCERNRDLEEVFEPGIGQPLDLLVIAVDLDIAIEAGIEKKPSNLDAYDAKGLCDIVKGWLPSKLPSGVIIVIPVASIEAWVIAALFPKVKRPEAEYAPAELLVQRERLARGSSGKPWKRVAEYRFFGQAVASRLKGVRQRCDEADRYAKKLRGALQTLRR